jgi:hypothetical protein
MNRIFLGLMAVVLCAPLVTMGHERMPTEMSKGELDKLVKAYIEYTQWKPSTNRTQTITEAQIRALEAYQMDLIRAKGAKGPPLPIPLTPDMDAQLVKEGVLPPVGDRGQDALIAFRFKNTPLSFVAEEYAKYCGKKVVVDKNVSAAMSVGTDKPVPKAQAALLIENALADAGLLVVSTGTNAVKIIRQRGDK